jgi:tetratricopeptide (TPR) repeat protein
MNGKLLPLALMLWMGVGSPALALNHAYADGVADYRMGRYMQAATKLKVATQSEPTNAYAHYYLANALVRTGEHERAAEEYRVCYMLDPRGGVSTYCAAALTGYNKPVPTQNDIRAFYNTVGGGMGVALSNIRKQVQSAQTKISRQVEGPATRALKDGTHEEQLVDNYTRERIEAVRYEQAINRNPRLGPEYFAEKERVINEAARDEKERIRREAREVAARYRRLGEQRQKMLDEVAHDLERQMTEKPGKNGVRLLAEGTDLYVRRYATVPPNQPIPDAKPAVARIYGQGASAEASPNRDLPPSDTSGNSVRGKVLN